MIYFQRPLLEHKDEILRAQTLLAKEKFEFCFHLDPAKPFQEFISRNKEIETGVDLQHMVQASFFLVRNSHSDLIGRVSIRHALNTHLVEFGGHIGYCVLPEFRKMGYATKILEKALIYLKENTSEVRALLTCNCLNEASIKTILKNKGVLVDQKQHETRITNRYWIKL